MILLGGSRGIFFIIENLKLIIVSMPKELTHYSRFIPIQGNTTKEYQIVTLSVGIN